MFKKKSEAQIKQPQELYCSNKGCFNEISIFHPMSHVLDVDGDTKKKYCFDCITDNQFSKIYNDTDWK